MADDIRKIDSPTDPERCQFIGKDGNQCNNKRFSEKTNYCKIHIGCYSTCQAQKQEARNYKLNCYRNRFNDLINSPEIKSLREEIALLRILIEERFNICETPHDLLMQSAPLADLISRVERVVATCTKIEQTHNVLLDRAYLTQFALQIIAIIKEHVKDPETLNKIGQAINKLLEE